MIVIVKIVVIQFQILIKKKFQNIKKLDWEKEGDVTVLDRIVVKNIAIAKEII